MLNKDVATVYIMFKKDFEEMREKIFIEHFLFLFSNLEYFNLLLTGC